MPRPGPRPYECVRRAWHSDRHQPIRGSLIQEIFRLANEVHGANTRKNKEWQEKLPFVVLKAEEIMYSKANSEMEYMDLTTLWGRANDAIDTIIRKDESTETGDLLRPCIEAALNLGCVPRRASRSQRHNSLRCYLSSGTHEPVDTSVLAPVVPSDGNTRPQHQGVPFRLPLPVASTCNLQSSTQQFVEWYSSLGAPVAVNYGPLGARAVSPSQELRDSIPISRSEFSHPSVESSDQDRHLSYPSESCTWSTAGRVYPLHYFLNQQGMRPQFHRHSPANLNCNSLGPSGSSGLHTREKEIGYPFLGSVPISCHEFSIPSVETSNSDQDRDPCPLSDACILPSTGHAYPSHHHEDLPNNSASFSLHTSVGLRGNAFAAGRMSDLHTRKGDISFLHNFLPAGNVGCAITETLNPGNLDGIAPDLECDLALRLGPSSVPCSDGENAWTREVEDVGSSSSHGGNKFNGLKTPPSSVNGIRC